MRRFAVEFEGAFEVEAETMEAAEAWCAGQLRKIDFAGRPVRVVDIVVVRTCRFCGCTDDKACFLDAAEAGFPGRIFPVPCSWADGEPDVCTNPACLAQLETAHAADRSTEGVA